MPQLDRTSARALVDAGYMPLSHYIEMFESEMMLQEVASPSTAPDQKWEKLHRIFASMHFTHK
jgi:hypothetical protein